MPTSTDTVRFARVGTLRKTARVVIEVPRGGFTKRKPDGRVDFVSPLPCPFNYGSIVGTQSDDGDPVDALVLGPRLSYGSEVEVPVRAVIGFVDAGVFDPKVVCSAHPLRRSERRRVERFFSVYAMFKRAIHVVRAESGRTVVSGWLARETGRGRDPAQ